MSSQKDIFKKNLEQITNHNISNESKISEINNELKDKLETLKKRIHKVHIYSSIDAAIKLIDIYIVDNIVKKDDSIDEFYKNKELENIYPIYSEQISKFSKNWRNYFK